MAKQQKKKAKKKNIAQEVQKDYPEIQGEAHKKLEKIKAKIEKFKEKVLSRFEDYTLGISLLPPSKDDKEKEKINLLVLIEDSDSKKMSKEELKEKLSGIIKGFAQEVDKTLNPEVLLLTELWQNCYDSKYEILGLIANSAPIHDKGMLSAIRLAEVHKTMVLKKFEKYIVSYIFGGSIVQGKATHESDVDVFIVIDDTDVKRMTRAELKDKLRAIIIGMAAEARQMLEAKREFHIQVYILTDFWENIKEANPVIFTVLRDGVPFYDRGIFMPWKQLLQMGRIKPSPEAIDMFIHSGDQFLDRVKLKLKEIGMEDFFWATITPSQAALMLYGLPPPTPKDAPEVLRHIFVKKEKLLEDKYVKMFEKILRVRKEMEHGSKKEISGRELDELHSATKEFLERMKSLFSEIQSLKEKEEFNKAFSEAIFVAREVLSNEGHKDVKEKQLLQVFKEELVEKSKLPPAILSKFEELFKAKADYEAGKLTKAETSNAVKNARSIIRVLVEHVQRLKSTQVESSKVRIKHSDNKLGEVIFLKNKAFIIKNLDNPEEEIIACKYSQKGSLEDFKMVTLEELDNALKNEDSAEKRFINKGFFEDLKKVFGENFEVFIK